MPNFYVGDEHLDEAGREAALKDRETEQKKSDSGKAKDQGRPGPKDDSTARDEGKTGTYSGSKPQSGGPQSGGETGAADDGEFRGGRKPTKDDKVPSLPSQSGNVR